MRSIILFLILLLLVVEVKGQLQQDNCSASEIKFMDYLVNNRLFDDAILLSKTFNISECPDSDSILFLKGWSYYNLKQLDTAATTLLKVNENPHVFLKSRFFASYCLAHIGDVESGHRILTELTLTNSMMSELKNTQLAGYSLLQRDMDSYEQYSSSFTKSYYALTENQITLNTLHSDIVKFKRKSPLLAGVLSAIIPGAGKIYAGKVGSGISNFFTVGILGAVTYESYSKGGLSNPKTVIFASLFSIAYAATVYGSVYSVKAYRDEFNQQMDQRILFHIHIPLRNVFN